MTEEATNQDRAEILTQALPYIQKYHGKIIVVKYGGNAMVSQELKQQVMEDLALLRMVGVRVVLIHGGGPEINSALEKMGKKPEFKDGLRVTDKETIEIVQMVLSGKVNKTLVNLLGQKGVKAIGLSGVDDRLIQATMKDPALGYVGRITEVNVQVLLDLMDQGYIPVISSIGWDDKGNIYNINADTAAACIAGAIGAERLFMMTDIAGILRDKDDPDSLIKAIDIPGLVSLFDQGVISGGMIPKVECCIDAIHRGVKRVVVLDGRVSHSILLEILTNEGVGTMVMEDMKHGTEDDETA
ncbi:MAG: acetylglutamate kinase [Oscillospiraceae bacterium]|nr:acetylglutamate kinase [Oscillospiraceae bacterium]MCD7749884.1 acetylglutamate kinase [Oscillospiraceae bacterium]